MCAQDMHRTHRSRTGIDCGRGWALSARASTQSLTLHAYACNVRSEVDAMKLQSLPCYCATLRQAARAVTALYEQALTDTGLPATQHTALQVMRAAPGLTTTELAEAIGIDQTTA